MDSSPVINDFTEREEQIIYTAVERALRMLPEVVGQLLLQKTATRELARQLYKDNPEFLKHKDIVSAEIEHYEGENPGIPHGKMLKDVTPVIKARIGTIAKLDFSPPEKPNDLAFKGNDHGEL